MDGKTFRDSYFLQIFTGLAVQGVEFVPAIADKQDVILHGKPERSSGHGDRAKVSRIPLLPKHTDISRSLLLKFDSRGVILQFSGHIDDAGPGAEIRIGLNLISKGTILPGDSCDPFRIRILDLIREVGLDLKGHLAPVLLGHQALRRDIEESFVRGLVDNDVLRPFAAGEGYHSLTGLELVVDLV